MKKAIINILTLGLLILSPPILGATNPKYVYIITNLETGSSRVFYNSRKALHKIINLQKHNIFYGVKIKEIDYSNDRPLP